MSIGISGIRSSGGIGGIRSIDIWFVGVVRIEFTHGGLLFNLSLNQKKNNLSRLDKLC
jgi:hypothetical protein